MVLSVLFENPVHDVNVSTMLRTVDFFGADLYVTDKQEVSNKASGGAKRGLERRFGGTSVPILDPSKWRRRIIVTDSSFTTHPADFVWRDSDLLVFGNEREGVSEGLQSRAIAKIGLPTRGIVRCLNVSAACASVLACVEGQARTRCSNLLRHPGCQRPCPGWNCYGSRRMTDTKKEGGS